MKKLFTLGVALVAFVSLGAQNLLTNPSFETWADGKAAPWDFYDSGSKSTYAQETGIVNDGTSAVKLTALATSNISQSYSDGLVEGDTYVLSFDYYVVSGDGTDVRPWAGWKSYNGTAYADIEHDWDVLRLGGGSTTQYLESNTGAWSTYSVETTVPANAAMFDFRMRGYNGSVVIFDNASFTKKGGSTAPSVTVNPKSLSFSLNELNPNPEENENAHKSVYLTGANLTGVLTVTLTGDPEFTYVGLLEIPPMFAITGTYLGVQYVPTAYGSHSATLTISGGGLTSDVIIPITGTASEASQGGENVLVNPSFETWADGKAAPWDFYDSGSKSTYAQETGIVKDGTSAVKVTALATSNVSQSYTQGLVEGEQYTFSFDYYVVSGDGTDVRPWAGWKSHNGTAYADIEHDWDVLRLGGGSTTQYLESNTGTWSTYSVVTTVPANAAMFDFRMRAYNGSVVIFDNAKFFKGTSSITGNNADAARITSDGVNVYVVTPDMVDVSVYDLSGIKVKELKKRTGEIVVDGLVKGKVYIVKAGDTVKKVIL